MVMHVHPSYKEGMEAGSAITLGKKACEALDLGWGWG